MDFSVTTNDKNGNSGVISIVATRAIEGLKSSGLDVTPDNFSLYYNYYSASDPNLKMAMDALLQQNGRLTQTQCQDLFRAHLSLEAEHKVLSTTVTSIENEIKQVMSSLGQATKDTSHYGQALHNFSGVLHTEPEQLEQIRTTMQRLANETRVMAEQNQRLHSQLVQSTQQLTETRYNLSQVKMETMVDPLTGVGNRKLFNNEIIRTTAEATEGKGHLSLLVVDIDHFKKFNDTHGHLVGDQVLRLVARTLVENLKGRDVIARYGGEEFVILLPDTRAVDAEKVGNQLRTSLGSKQIRRKESNETLGVITISIGIAEYHGGEDTEAFISRADAALYEAKRTGRNKVVISAT